MRYLVMLIQKLVLCMKKIIIIGYMVVNKDMYMGLIENDYITPQFLNKIGKSMRIIFILTFITCLLFFNSHSLKSQQKIEEEQMAKLINEIIETPTRMFETM